MFLYGVFGEHISTRFRKWEGFYNLLLLTAKRVRSGCFSVDTDELGNTKTEHSGTILTGIACNIYCFYNSIACALSN